MGAKKLLAAYDPSHPDAQPGEFLVPWAEDRSIGLMGISSGQAYSHGLVVYLGREVSEKDVFAKLVDAGRKFPDLDQALATISRYLYLVQEQKIGSVVTLIEREGLFPEFQLAQVDKTPRD